MLDEEEFDRWQDAAASASASAELQAAAGQHHWACFLAEQASQLAMKGLLHGIGAGGWGHDLVELGQRLAGALDEPVADDRSAALQRLSRHYIPARYPDAHPGGTPAAHYGPADSVQALADTELILLSVTETWALLRAQAGG